MTSPSTTTCPACGAAATGKFCSACGASLGSRACAHCRAELSAQARFCHRCGRPAGSVADKGPASPSDRTAWIAAGTLCVVLVAGIAYKVTSAAPQPVAPDMANTGAGTGSGPGGPGGAGPAPDITAMTPRERFDRLFNRIMQASERGDSSEVERFTPMALGAYQQLDSVNVDARYHAAVLHLQVGDFPAAMALADTILTESPGHLFGYLIRGTGAELQNDPAGRRKAERDFLAHYDAEMAAKRVEYLEHAPVLDEFKKEADRADSVNSKR